MIPEMECVLTTVPATPQQVLPRVGLQELKSLPVLLQQLVVLGPIKLSIVMAERQEELANVPNLLSV